MTENCEKRAIISKDTLVPIAMVLTMGVGIWFAATLTSKVYNNENRVSKVEDSLNKLIVNQNDMLIKITAIGINIETIQKTLK